ncbi:hypothetical protein OK006_4727 [Actinobacteria bacterium OK006]|nr:hypothetical protein OK006_4727 [Actinobacteria bacterium OK006]
MALGRLWAICCLTGPSGLDEFRLRLCPHLCLCSHIAESRDRRLCVLLKHAVENPCGHLRSQNLAAPETQSRQPTYDLGDVQHTGARVGEQHVMRHVVAHQ